MLAMRSITQFGFLLIAAAVPVILPAQRPDSAACSYRACAVRLEPSWGGPRLVQGIQGQTVGSLGIFRTNLSVLESTDSSAAYVRSFRRAHRASTMLAFVGSVATVVFVHTARDDEFLTGTTPLVSAGVAAVALYASLPFTLKAQRSLARAIWWHNERFARN